MCLVYYAFQFVERLMYFPKCETFCPEVKRTMWELNKGKLGFEYNHVSNRISFRVDFFHFRQETTIA